MSIIGKKLVSNKKPGKYATRFYKEVVDKKTGEISLVHDGRTRQEFKKECDVNHIVKKYGGIGFVPNPKAIAPVFRDMTVIPELGSVLSRAAIGRQAFEALPATLRKRFNNRMEDLVDFISDDNNYDEALKLGLVVKKELPKEPAPSKVIVVADTSVPPVVPPKG